MKIRQLDLIRIGPFTDQTLKFDKGNFGLHLVYGSNEAGKSSTLKALSHWLFGIPGPATSQVHFIHSHKDLRVGGTIENHAGEMLTCVRRHGEKSSLRVENDRDKLDPAVLSSYMGGLTQEQFQTQFGIDLQQLVAGGKAIAKGGGQLGESLFAAGSGSANMPSLRKLLESQCEALFKPSKATVPKVNAAISVFNAACKEVREKSVKSKDWQRLSDELDDLREEKKKLDNEQMESRAQRDRLQRILTALPSIGALKDRREELAEVGEVARLGEDFATRRVTCTEGLAAAKAARKSNQEELEALQAQLDALGETPGILEHASAVESLYEDLSVHRQATRTLPQRIADTERAESKARSLLKTLGKEPALENADALRINPAVRAKIHDLAGQRSGVLTALESSKRDFDKRAQELDTLTDAIGKIVQPDDPAALKRAISHARKSGDLDSSIDKLAQSVRQKQLKIDADLSRLPMWSGGIEELLAQAIPTPETVLSFANRFESNDQTATQLEIEVSQLEIKLARAGEDLHALTLNQDVPTEEQLQRARRARNEAWDTVQQVWQSGATDQMPTAIDGFQTEMKACDEIADRLRREAQMVSDKARLIAVIDRCETQIASRKKEQKQCTADREGLAQDWLEIWLPAGIAPSSPASMPLPTEMKAWLERYDTLIAAADELSRLQSDLQSERQRRQHHLDSLLAIYPDAKPSSDQQPDERLDPVLDACTERLDLLNNAIAQAEQMRSRQRQLTQDLATDQIQWREAEEARNQWQTQWNNAMVAIQSDGSLSAGEAQEVLKTIDELVQEVDQASKLRDLVRHQTDEVEDYESRVKSLLEKLSPDSDKPNSSVNTETTVGQWHDDLKQARETQTNRRNWLGQLEKLEKQRRNTATKIETHRANLAALCVEAGCDTPEEIAEIERRAQRRQAIEQGIDKIESELRGLSQGVKLDTFIADAMQEDADRLTPQIEQLSEKIERTETRRSELSETIGGKQRELQGIDGNDEAAAANERAEEALARARTHSEDYVRAKLGAILLKTAVTRYRQRNQGPILKRASELFARFTLGNFSGLETDSTDEHDTVLVGVRGDDESKLVHVNEMSEGTCDQLFLALRLAALEMHLQSNPPFPFIVDDILTNFDNARSAATLATLGELSSSTQVILFTHHQHLVELAQKNVPEDILFLHSLDASSSNSSADH